MTPRHHQMYVELPVFGDGVPYEGTVQFHRDVPVQDAPALLLAWGNEIGKLTTEHIGLISCTYRVRAGDMDVCAIITDAHVHQLREHYQIPSPLPGLPTPAPQVAEPCPEGGGEPTIEMHRRLAG